MTLPLLIFGLISGSLLSVLVGLVGARRNIGFGWTFLISVIFTPLVGLIVALISDPLPTGSRKWGCLGSILGVLAIVGLIFIGMAMLGMIAVI